MAEQVTHFSPESKPVKVRSGSTAATTDSNMSKSCQVGTKCEALWSCPTTTCIASHCSIILIIMLILESHLVDTSTFSFFCGSCTTLKYLFLFQLYENTATIFLQRLRTRSRRGSSKPLFTARSKLWPKQLKRFHFRSVQASLMLLPLSVVIATSFCSSKFHYRRVVLMASWRCWPVWSLWHEMSLQTVTFKDPIWGNVVNSKEVWLRGTWRPEISISRKVYAFFSHFFAQLFSCLLIQRWDSNSAKVIFMR